MDKELTSAWHRDAEQWQLNHERKAVAARLQAVNPAELCGSHESLSAICKSVYEPVMGWTVGACESLRDRLIYLLGGKSINKGAETSAKVIQNGEKYKLATYDVLGNERHKAVCELRKLRERDAKIWNIEISIALGLDLDASNDDVCDRLIYLLGADTILKEDGDGMARCDFERGTVLCVSVGARDVPEEAVVGERNFSALETPKTVENQQKPTEKGTIDAPIVSITDDLRKFAETFRYEWYDEKEGIAYYAASDIPPTIDSVNGADYINAIADRIDEQFSRICEQQESVLQQTISDMSELRRECDRLTEALDELQADPLGDVLVRVENERDELQSELDNWKGLAGKNARALLRKVSECNKLVDERDMWHGKVTQLAEVVDRYVGRYEDVFDLLRDAREEHKMLDRMSTETSANFHAMRDRVWCLEAERDELKANLDESVANQVQLEKDFNSVRRQWDECEERCEGLLDLIRDAATDYEAERMECVELRQKLSARDAIIDNYHQRMKATESKCEELRKKYTELADHTIDVEARLADYVGQYDPTDAKIRELRRAAKRDADVIESLSGQLADMTRECDELLDLIRDAAEDYMELRERLERIERAVNGEG